MQERTTPIDRVPSLGFKQSKEKNWLSSKWGGGGGGAKCTLCLNYGGLYKVVGPRYKTDIQILDKDEPCDPSEPINTQSGQRQAWQFWKYFSNKSVFWKIVEVGMLKRSQTTTLLQIFCELLLYSQVILKSMKVADGTF